jgi:hypothetical protein
VKLAADANVLLSALIGGQATRVLRHPAIEEILTAEATWAEVQDRQMPKWTVIVSGRELPVRPLVLQAAGVAPNDPTNSHAAVAKLKSLGFDTRYEGNSV